MSKRKKEKLAEAIEKLQQMLDRLSVLAEIAYFEAQTYLGEERFFSEYRAFLLISHRLNNIAKNLSQTVETLQGLLPKGGRHV